MVSKGYAGGHFIIYGKAAFVFYRNVLVTAYQVPKSEAYRKNNREFKRAADTVVFRRQLASYGYNGSVK